MSRFVSGGTNDEAIERDEAWLKAQEAIEATRREKAELGKQEGGKSLYETLQANKAAKQEQFEEALRLRNQFRSLDEDEAAFLDNVLESTRAKEAEVKQETAEQLAAFRKRQEEAEKAARQTGPPENAVETGDTSWTVGTRKRKKRHADILAGVKLRKASSADDPNDLAKADQGSAAPSKGNSPEHVIDQAGISKQSTPAVLQQRLPSASATREPTKPADSLGLGDYSSDEHD